MTTGPRLKLGSHLVPGLAAVALFAVLAAVFLTASFEQAAGFPTDVSITANIGYALFDLQRLGTIPSEGFIVAFITIAIVLDAALDGTLMLATRDDQNQSGDSVRTDGGHETDTHVSHGSTGNDRSALNRAETDDQRGDE